MYCKDMVKFGGPGKRKQACIQRKCMNMNSSYKFYQRRTFGGENLMKKAEDVSKFSFDHESNIYIKKEIKQEIKTEPLDESENVLGEANEDVMEKAGDVSNFSFDHENLVLPIKKEIKEEIKTELLEEEDGSM